MDIRYIKNNVIEIDIEEIKKLEWTHLIVFIDTENESVKYRLFNKKEWENIFIPTTA